LGEKSPFTFQKYSNYDKLVVLVVRFHNEPKKEYNTLENTGTIKINEI